MKVTAKEYGGGLVESLTLDGVDVLEDAFEADDEEGYVLRYKKQLIDDGIYCYYIDPDTDEPAIERLEGDVKIVIRRNSES